MNLFNMEYFGIQSTVIHPKGNVVQTLIEHLFKSKFEIKSGDIVAISSKVVAMEQNQIVSLSEIIPSEKAMQLAKESDLSANFVQLVLDKTEQVIGVVSGALLTLNAGLVQANGGIDKSNAGLEKAILLPENCDEVARSYKKQIEQKFNISDIGVLIVDSTTRPLRLGTVGLALASIGFPAVVDDRGSKDIFGYTMKITSRNIADNLASGANLVMGEAAEQIPFVIIRGLQNLAKQFTWNQSPTSDLKIASNKCLYFSNVTYKMR